MAGYTLVGRNASPFTRRVAITLSLLDQPFEHVKISPVKTPEEVAKWHPVTRVPILVLPTGEKLIESGAIVDHLLETHDQWARLMPAKGPARLEARSRIALATSAMEKAVVAYYEIARRPEDKRHPPYQEAARAQSRAAIAVLEEEMAGVSVPKTEADVTEDALTAAIAVTFIGRVQPEILEGLDMPRLSALTQTLEAMPVFQKNAIEA